MKRRAQESGDPTGRAHAPIEIRSYDESLCPSQPKPPMRKKLRLHVLSMPAPVKSKGAGDIGGADDRSTRKRVIPGYYSPQLHSSPSQASSSAGAVPIVDTVHFLRLVISSLTKFVNGKKAMVRFSHLLSLLPLVDEFALSQTKVHKCHRCERVMYPGPQSFPLNHPRAVCSDGL